MTRSLQSEPDNDRVPHRSPGPRLRRLLRSPGLLYDWRLGWLLGHRFLRLTHTGRRSGEPHQTVLEVVGQNRTKHEFIVVAGLGRSAHWYRNLQLQEGVEVAIGRERFVPIHRELPILEAEEVLAAYERGNRWIAPIIHCALSWLVGWRYDGSQAARQRLVGELPLIGLRQAGLESPSEGVERPDAGHEVE
jgi:deazaflavin-dependent oxidoreductase (nitroreductase family)